MDIPDTPKSDKSNAQSVNTLSKTVQNKIFGVSGNCELCKERIEKAAKSVNGISGAVWDVNTMKIHVVFNPMKTNPDAIQGAIAKAGHDTEKFKAPEEVYKQLPECCLYRK